MQEIMELEGNLNKEKEETGRLQGIRDGLYTQIEGLRD